MRVFLTLFLISIFLSGYSQIECPIGDQIWMNKNLDVDTLRNGDKLFKATSEKDWKKAVKNKVPAYCYYLFNEEVFGIYGKLYNYYAIIDPRNIAPLGWHIPTITEWNKLVKFEPNNNVTSNDGFLQADDLRSNEFQFEGAVDAENAFGFNAIPNGFIYDLNDNIKFKFINLEAWWWTSTKSFNDLNSQLCIDLYTPQIQADNNKSIIHAANSSVFYGCGVRCIKD